HEGGILHHHQASRGDGHGLVGDHQRAVRRHAGKQQGVGRIGRRPNIKGVDEQIGRRRVRIHRHGLGCVVGNVDSARGQGGGGGAAPIGAFAPKSAARASPDGGRGRRERHGEGGRAGNNSNERVTRGKHSTHGRQE